LPRLLLASMIVQALAGRKSKRRCNMERSVRKAILHCLAALAACLAGASVSSAQETAEPTAATVPPVQAAPVILYTKDNAPPTPKLADLPLKESVTRYGVTWTFEKPSPVGQFVNGDWYVVGPAIVV
jgi:peptidoglycan/LPS O-acetylase OafA/YrhL